MPARPAAAGDCGRGEDPASPRGCRRASPLVCPRSRAYSNGRTPKVLARTFDAGAFMTWTGRRTLTRLAVAGVTLAALVAAAPAVSAGTLGGHPGNPGSPGGPVAGTAAGAVRGVADGPVDEFL